MIHQNRWQQSVTKVLKWLPSSIAASLAIRLHVLASHVVTRIPATAISTTPRTTSSTFERNTHDDTATHVTLASICPAPGIGVASLISQVTVSAAHSTSRGWIRCRAWCGRRCGRLACWLACCGLICWVGCGLRRGSFGWVICWLRCY